MDEMRRLVTALRERAAGLKEAAKNCVCAEDKLALGIRADEVEHCADAIEKAVGRAHDGRGAREGERDFDDLSPE